MEHKPVLLNEVIQALKSYPHPLLNFLDATFGRGGHTSEVLKNFPSVQVVALDQDADAIEYGRNMFKSEVEQNKIIFFHTNYSNYNAGGKLFDAILADLGVSSPQLDNPSRGFSIYHEGPLDMRMDLRQTLTAKEIINNWTEEELADVFYNYGDVHKSFRVAKAIVSERKIKPIETTTELSKIIERSLGWQKKGHHPATECFMALRICVNNEFEHMEKGIHNFIQMLKPGGRLLVITFHSAEDRRVKKMFLSAKEWGEPLQKKVIKPTREEQEQNPRSRSAYLRIFERGN